MKDLESKYSIIVNVLAVLVFIAIVVSFVDTFSIGTVLILLGALTVFIYLLLTDVIFRGLLLLSALFSSILGL